MANPTTNYGWQMPTPTDLVTDLPADFEIFGQAADGTVFANAALAVSKTIVDAKGDLIAATAADTVSRLAVGANDTILTADSAAATGMKWAAAAGGGKVLQVVSGVTTTQTNIATTTFTDTTLTATITPTLSTSKVLVIWSIQYRYMRYAAGGQGAGIKLLRGSTNIGNFGGGNRQAAAFAYGQTADGGGEFRTTTTGNTLDSPATTSATTYKIQMAVYDTSSSGQIIAQDDSTSTSTITLLEIGA